MKDVGNPEMSLLLNGSVIGIIFYYYKTQSHEHQDLSIQELSS